MRITISPLLAASICLLGCERPATTSSTTPKSGVAVAEHIQARLHQLPAEVNEDAAFAILGIDGEKVPLELISGIADGPGGVDIWNLYALGEDRSRLMEIEGFTLIEQKQSVTRISSIRIRQALPPNEGDDIPSEGPVLGQYWEGGVMKQPKANKP